jgi:hypothetical protein
MPIQLNCGHPAIQHSHLWSRAAQHWPSVVEASQAQLAKVESPTAGYSADFERERERADRLIAELLRATDSQPRKRWPGLSARMPGMGIEHHLLRRAGRLVQTAFGCGMAVATPLPRSALRFDVAKAAPGTAVIQAQTAAVSLRAPSATLYSLFLGARRYSPLRRPCLTVPCFLRRERTMVMVLRDLVKCHRSGGDLNHFVG